jgi:outer membrane biosynthesis protein TonB
MSSRRSVHVFAIFGSLAVVAIFALLACRVPRSRPRHVPAEGPHAPMAAAPPPRWPVPVGVHEPPKDPLDACFDEDPVVPPRGRPDPPQTDGGAPVRGSLDKEVIRTVIRSHVPDVKACYEARLTVRPRLRGRVAVQFVIQADGTINRSVIQHTTMNDATVEACVGRLVCRWQFPRPFGGGTVTVTYPFNFTPWEPDAGADGGS